MTKSRLICVALAATVAASLLSCATSLAAITVNLRVEGSTQTLFEGPVSTEAIVMPPGIATETTPEPHPCDIKDNGEHAEGFGNAAANATTALYDAALANNLAFNAKWYTSLNDFEVTQVGSDINQSTEPYDSWGYAVNYTTANVGGCQFQLAPGSEVLWAYNYFNLKHLLNLSGPSSVVVGAPFTVHVTDGQTGEPVSGASIGEDVNGLTTTIPSSPTTNASGDATITLTHTGTVKLKATQSESVRSNGLTLAVGSASCSSCGANTSNSVVSKSAPLPDVASAGGVKRGHHYTRHGAPRLLSGSVEVPAGATLHEVRIRLQRRFKGRCYDFSGSRERFVHVKCGRIAFFSVGSSQSFTYLLPSRLPAGSYTYQVETVDAAGHVTKPIKGVSSVTFTVR